jgi:PncC family amidohydrolase
MVAVAESLTGGLLGAALTEMPGSSGTFAGGVIAYATELKQRLLGVPADLLAAYGAVHPDVARAMAEGACRVLGSPYGLAVTGVAGPDPQDGRPVGTVYAAVAAAGGAAVAGTAGVVGARPSGTGGTDGTGGVDGTSGRGGADGPGGAVGADGSGAGSAGHDHESGFTTVVERLPLTAGTPPSRARIRRQTVVHALDLLCRRLRTTSPADHRADPEQPH